MGNDQVLKTGDTYNPYKIFVGIYIPNAIAESTKLSQSAKLCFGRLAQYAGKNGRCYPKQETLAQQIGLKSVKQIGRCISELEYHKLIKVVKATGADKLKHKSDTYYFIWDNELFTGEPEPDKNVQSEGGDENLGTNDISEPDKNVQSDTDRNVQPNGNRIIEEGDSVESKDSNSEFSKTENSLKTENTLGSNNNATNSESETKAKSLGQPKNQSTASKLRSMSKSKEVKQKLKGKPWIVPKANVPYWEIMKQYKFKVPQDPTGDIYETIDSLITSLRRGEYFNSMPEYKSLANRKITPEDFKRFYEHFTLVAFSPKHYPVNIITKKSYRNWYLDRMLMHKDYSMFAIYLDNPPKLIADTAKPLDDPTPHYTNFLINILKEKLEWDLDNGNRAKAIDAVTKLNTTFERLEPKIINYSYFCGDFYKRAKLLVEMFESHQDRGIPIRPEYINTDKTHSIFIPEYMNRVGLIKS